MRWAIAIGLAVVLNATESLAAEQGCKKEPEVTGKCEIVPGVLNFTADNGPVLWVGRSTKSYAITGNIPNAISKLFDRDLTAYVYGDFEFCPLPGRSRFDQENGCIESASHIAVVPSRDEPQIPH